MGDKTITITEEEFSKVTSKAMAENERIKELINISPSLMLAMIVFTVELKNELFKEDKE